jgi:outer membrane lipoprotein-sorting protein
MTLVSILVATVAAQGSDIDRYLQPNLHDATFTTRVLHADQRELAKINSDFGESYRFDSTTIRLKEPFKLRIDAKVQDTTLLYIENGPTQILRIPRIGVKSRTDLSQKPGRRQTAFDFGLLTPSLFDDFYSAQFVRMDRATGDPVFDIKYAANLRDNSRSRIWIDPVHHVIARREWYGQDGHQQATFFYSEPENVDGIWLPTRLEVKNTDNVTAGVTQYQSIKVNTGLSDDIFPTR